MMSFRLLALVLFVGIVGYTLGVVSDHGWNLFPPFIGAIVEQTWQGQFNLDFSFYLLLSALWIAWRHGFSLAGFVFGGLALIGGMMFFAPYLLIASIRSAGNTNLFLSGDVQRNQLAAGKSTSH